MLNTGTKVWVVASSCQKKIGPRHGSIGYVSGFNDFDSTSIDGNIVLSPRKIIFLRYGFEKRLRVETREVLLACPILRDKKADASSQINSLCNEIKRFKTKQSSSHIVVVTPINDGTSLMDCSAVEFRAWISSYLRCPYFNSFTQLTLSHGYFTNFGNELLKKRTAWETMRLACIDNEFRESKIRYWLYDKENWEDRINALRIMTLFCTRANIRYISRFAYDDLNYLLQIDAAPREIVYKKLLPFLLNSAALEVFKPIARENKDLCRIIDDIEAIQNGFRGLSARVERELKQGNHNLHQEGA